MNKGKVDSVRREPELGVPDMAKLEDTGDILNMNDYMDGWMD